jgi:hypothetical protein
MFAPHIEAIWGTRAFMRYYVVCATGAALAQFAVAPNSLVIGASGAIYGLLIAFGFMFPDVVIYLFFVFPLRAIQAVFFIALLTLVMATGSGGSRIAHVAHLGGLLTGLVYLKAPMWWQQFRLWRADARFRNPLGRRRAVGYDEAPRENDMSDEVDRILEKISAHGVGSLTSAEHATMQKYAQRKK